MVMKKMEQVLMIVIKEIWARDSGQCAGAYLCVVMVLMLIMVMIALMLMIMLMLFLTY